MIKVFWGLSLFIFMLFSTNLKAIEFEDLPADQKFELYKDSCDQGQMANCYQVALWYKNNQRIDPVENKKLRSTIEELKENR